MDVDDQIGAGARSCVCAGEGGLRDWRQIRIFDRNASLFVANVMKYISRFVFLIGDRLTVIKDVPYQTLVW